MLFNVSVIYSNIKYLAKIYGIKLGDIEAGAEVSPGYLSRLGSKETDKSSSVVVDLLISASQKLNVSIDTLLYRDLSKATESEEKIIKLVSKLTLETNEGIRGWNKQSEEMFANRVPLKKGIHPLSVRGEYSNDYDQWDPPHFLSRFDEDAKLGGPCYETNLVGSALFYVVKTDAPMECAVWGSGTAYEMYIFHDAQVIPVCNCLRSNPLLFSMAETLYEAASRSAKKGSLDDKGDSLIDDYLRG